MSECPTVAILQGGISGEREVSLRSAEAVRNALADRFSLQMITVKEAALPEELNNFRGVVFSVLHGTFGEDGGMQKLLQEAGIPFVGSEAHASSLCMDKTASKERVVGVGVPVAPGWCFPFDHPPTWEEVVAKLGDQAVLKPNTEGSSLGLSFPTDAESWCQGVGQLPAGRALVERFIPGRELSVGILEGKALGIVEIVPDSGQYDYVSKYTTGKTEYRVPAPLPDGTSSQIRTWAEDAFRELGCRDYARVDFRLSPSDEAVFLEINTLPGFTELSLFPRSAQVCGWSFADLLERLVESCWERTF
ncbi:MAG: D-alanine--D-alanine ligase [Opitutales bacterium]|nr:D-alanine--D-alanine ligase [Opitutales bacterium]MCH8539953.1 D-alanine--D-alanine ligase [Opitutales bacterium]